MIQENPREVPILTPVPIVEGILKLPCRLSFFVRDYGHNGSSRDLDMNHFRPDAAWGIC